MGIFLGKIFVLFAGITIISLSQFSCLSRYKLDIVENSFSYPFSAINSDDKVELLPDTQKTIVSKICYQDSTTKCLPLLSMTNGRPVSEIDSPMKITFRQSGGYAGLLRGCEINTERLSSEEARELKSLVDQSGILEAQSKQSPNLADVFNYLITIETRDKTHQVSFDELSLPREIIPLIDFLQDRSDYIKGN